MFDSMPVYYYFFIHDAIKCTDISLASVGGSLLLCIGERVFSDCIHCFCKIVVVAHHGSSLKYYIGVMVHYTSSIYHF